MSSADHARLAREKRDAENASDREKLLAHLNKVTGYNDRTTGKFARATGIPQRRVRELLDEMVEEGIAHRNQAGQYYPPDRVRNRKNKPRQKVDPELRVETKPVRSLPTDTAVDALEKASEIHELALQLAHLVTSGDEVRELREQLRVVTEDRDRLKATLTKLQTVLGQ